MAKLFWSILIVFIVVVTTAPVEANIPNKTPAQVEADNKYVVKMTGYIGRAKFECGLKGVKMPNSAKFIDYGMAIMDTLRRTNSFEEVANIYDEGLKAYKNKDLKISREMCQYMDDYSKSLW